MLNCSGIWLQKGSKGVWVKTLQKDLNTKNISQKCLNGGVLAVDGNFGSVTDKVVRYAQEKILHVQVDGIVGPQTCAALNNYNVTGNGWTRIYYTRDSQDTKYTCGPSSLKMALSVYGIYYDELTLANMLGSRPGEGTENNAIIDFVNDLGKGLKAWEETFKSWGTLQSYLSAGWPVILRIASYSRPGGEHYVLLAGLNVKEGRVELGDPSNGGFRATTTTDILDKIRKVSRPSIIVISK